MKDWETFYIVIESKMNKFEKLMELLNEYDETEKINLYGREIEWKDIIWYNRWFNSIIKINRWAKNI